MNLRPALRKKGHFNFDYESEVEGPPPTQLIANAHGLKKVNELVMRMVNTGMEVDWGGLS